MNCFNNLRTVLAVVCLTIVFFSVCPLLGQEDNTPLEVQLVNIETQYRIKICRVISYPVGQVSGQNPALNEIEKYGKMIVREIRQYAPAVVQKTRIKQIVLVKELTFQNQKRFGVPDFKHNFLFLDIMASADSPASLPLGGAGEEYQRKVFHHNFFHLIDFADDGQMYKDEEWSGLNPEGFQYKTGSNDMQNDIRCSLPDETLQGFLNRYSTTGVEEDKAEIFANLMVSYPEVMWRAEQDDIIKKKVFLMKEFCRKFSPELSAQFWENQQWGPLVNELQCRVSDIKGIYGKSEAISVTLIVKNISSRIVKLLVPEKPPNAYFFIMMTIKNAKGQILKVKSWPQEKQISKEKVRLIELVSRDVYRINLANLRKFYTLEPGRYQMQVEFLDQHQYFNNPQQDQAWTGNLVSKPVFFEVK